MKEHLEEAIAKVLSEEGGYTDDASDSGGITNFGITRADYSLFIGHIATEAEMRAMPMADARTIYKTKYWDACRLDEIHSRTMCLLIFDQAVNVGVHAASTRAQLSANAAGLDLSVDGSLGPLSVKGLNVANLGVWAKVFCKTTYSYYANIVSNDRSQGDFINGWINRANDLLDIAYS